MKIIKFLVALGFLSALFVGTYLFLELRPTSNQSEKIVVEVKPGPFKNVIDDLYEKGLIRNKRLISRIATFTKADQKAKMGEYELTTDMWPHQILNVIVSGKSLQRSFTIQEGLNIFEIANVIELNKIATKEEFLKLVRDEKFIQDLIGIKAPSLEGYLYPDTYFYTKGMPLERIVRVMVGHFRSVIKEVAPHLENDKAKLHKVVILASMIEKETGAPEERPTISSVFHNRIKKKMRFQSDPTILYGMAVERGELVRNIRRKDILAKTPYNTYTVNGLPVGPIANPGKESIVATLSPAKTEYLFFVSMNEGRHYFSKTYKEHNEAVKKYQLTRENREGKSWRDMNK